MFDRVMRGMIVFGIFGGAFGIPGVIGGMVLGGLLCWCVYRYLSPTP